MSATAGPRELSLRSAPGNNNNNKTGFQIDAGTTTTTTTIITELLLNGNSGHKYICLLSEILIRLVPKLKVSQCETLID